MWLWLDLQPLWNQGAWCLGKEQVLDARRQGGGGASTLLETEMETNG
jgi:hypothetical protein